MVPEVIQNVIQAMQISKFYPEFLKQSLGHQITKSPNHQITK
jgi:hypothetical protein